MPAKIVSAALFELRKELRCPVRFASRIIHLVRIVEERAEASEIVPRERAIERQQVFLDGVSREVIDDEPFPAWRCTFDELAVPCDEECIERPAPRRRGPVQPSIRLNVRREVRDL